MENNNAKNKVIIYIALTFLFSIQLYFIIAQRGGLESSSAALFVIPLMWAPGIAGLITTLIYQKNLRGMGWGFGKVKYYLIAFLMPILYASVTYGAVWLTGLGKLEFSLVGARGLMTSLSLGVLTALLTALGEEIGWRGLLVPQLFQNNTFARTALISGVIWGIWHIPLIIGGGYSSGAPTWFAVTAFMFVVTGMSFAFAWVRLASGSIWPAALMHAVHNSFIQSFLDKVTVNTGNTDYFSTEFGLALAVMGIIVALVFWRVGVPPMKKAL